MKIIKRIVQFILLVIIVSIIGFLIYAKTGVYKADESVSSYVEVGQFNKKTNALEYTTESDVGFIFYPGGKVDYEAYSYYGAKLRENGVNAFIVKMPLNLAILDINQANEVILNHPEIKTWYIAGHSLGGSSASMFADSNPNALEGVVFLASYPLSELEIKELSIFAENDGLILQDELNQYTMYLSIDDYFTIEGANHAGFGMYGEQDGDLEATLSSLEQMDIVIENILQFIGK